MSGEPFGTITIPRPHVPYGPVGIPAPLSDARYLRDAARHIEQGYQVGGSNLTAAVLKLLRDAADAIEAMNQQISSEQRSARDRAEGMTESEITREFAASRIFNQQVSGGDS